MDADTAVQAGDEGAERTLFERLHNTTGAWVVLVCSLLLTLAAWYVADSYIYARANAEFDALTLDAQERIEQRIENYTAVLRAGVSFIDTLQRLPTRKEWQRFVQGLQLGERFPGIQGYGFALMLEPGQVAAHEAAVRAEGFEAYRVYPEGERERYSAIVYLEPFDWRNQRAFGYDMYSEPVRRAAMERAARTGTPAASGRVTLVQETAEDVQAGFLIYLPVYAAPAEEDGVPGAVLGYVYSPFRMGDLMDGTLGSTTGDVVFSLYDGLQAIPEALLYDGSERLPEALRPAFSRLARLEVAGREWTVDFSSMPRFERRLSTLQPAIIATAALAVDLLLFLLLLSTASQSRRIKAAAEARRHELDVAHERLLRMQQIAGLAFWELDLRQRRLRADPALRLRYGFDAQDFCESLDVWSARIHPRDRERTLQLVERALRENSVYRNRFTVVLPDGRERVMESMGFPQAGSSEVASVLSGLEREITEEVRKEEQLALHASVFESAQEAILITDPQANIISVNSAFSEVTGYSPDKVVGQNPRLLRSGEQGAAFYRVFWEGLSLRGHWDGEICNRRRDGSLVHGHLSVAAVKNAEGQLSHYVGLFTDLSQQKAQELQLQRLASFDPLTDLPNRALLNDRLRRAMSETRRARTQLAVCYLDLDGFKEVNDHQGHEAGDELLVQVAGRLRQLLRAHDTAARIGGDEFLLLIAGLEDTSACIPILQRLVQGLASPYLVHGHFAEVSASIGVTLYPSDDTDADTLIRHADQAMYRAKDAGRNRFELFDLSLAERSRDYQSQVVAVGNALAAGELLLHYQPKVDLHTGRVIGAEALLRWQHPERGLLYPDAFIQYLDEPLHNLSFGRWVLRSALSQLRSWRTQNLEIGISVNVSGSHLQQPEFVAELRQLLRQYPDIPPQDLELEVLETSALEDVEHVSAVLAECRGLGVRISIDDFGTGYSSLVYLRDLGADLVKVDQTFVRGMLDNEQDRAIVEGVVRLAQVFGREVIAEGVETEEHGLALLRLGCHLAQGWGIARAMPPEELPRWVAHYRMPDAWIRAAAPSLPLTDDAAGSLS